MVIRDIYNHMINEMINWGAFQTLPSFSPIRHTISNGTSDIITDKFIDVPGVDPDELRTGIRAEWETCGGDANLAKKIAIKNIKQDPHYYSGLHQYGIKEEDHVCSKKINPRDLFKGIEIEKQLGLSSRDAAKKALGHLSKDANHYPKDPRVIYGDYSGEAEPDAVLQEDHAKKYPYGMIETWKFFEMGSDSDLGHFNDLLKKGQYDGAWEFLKSVTEHKDTNVDGVNQELEANANKMTTVVKENKIQGTAVSALVDEEIDPSQLAMGITVEMEHTDNENVATEIAKDHLKKDGNYYTKLQQAGLADECSPSMSSGLGDSSHAINKEFRIGEDMTPTAGNNIVGSMGDTPSTQTVGKKDYKKMENSTPKTQHTKLTTYKDLKKLAEGAKMVGRWTIDAYPTTEDSVTPRLEEIHKKFDNAITTDKNGGNPIPMLMEIALEYVSNKDKAFKIVQNWMYEGTDFLTGKRKKKPLQESVTGYPMSKDAIEEKIKENQDVASEKKKKIEEDAGRFTTKYSSLSPSMLVRHMHETEARRIGSVCSALSEIYKACQSTVNESTGDQTLTVEGVGKMSLSNIKETVAKKMSEMLSCSECGDYAALTKHTTNGQLSVLESLKKSILAHLKEQQTSISAASIPVSPGITESTKQKSVYRRFFGE